MGDDQTSDQPSVLTERHHAVLVITLNRPRQMNAINNDLARRLCAAVVELENDPELRVGVLAGSGRGFCAGMDLKAFAQGEGIEPLMQFVTRGCRKPLVAAVEGFALAGGLEFVLTCDLVVAAEDARFGIPEVGVGLFAGAGGLYRLPARVGYGKAMEMALTGDPISAREAERYGLVVRLTQPGGALAAAIELAERIADRAPLAVMASKQLVQASQGVTEEEFWEIQQAPHATVFSSNDAKEGPLAFAEKRPPVWTGS